MEIGIRIYLFLISATKILLFDYNVMCKPLNQNLLNLHNYCLFSYLIFSIVDNHLALFNMRDGMSDSMHIPHVTSSWYNFEISYTKK